MASPAGSPLMGVLEKTRRWMQPKQGPQDQETEENEEDLEDEEMQRTRTEEAGGITGRADDVSGARPQAPASPRQTARVWGPHLLLLPLPLPLPPLLLMLLRLMPLPLPTGSCPCGGEAIAPP